MTKIEVGISALIITLILFLGLMVPKACRTINQAGIKLERRGLKSILTDIWEGTDANNK